MPAGLLLIAIMLMFAAIRHKEEELFALLKSDFTGSGNFVEWILAIAVLSAIGTIDKLKPITDAFLVLIVLVIVLANGKDGNNLFDNIANQIKEGTS